MANRKAHQNGQPAAGGTRAALYPRVSSKGQEEDGTSLESQEQRCRVYAASKGYVVDEGHVYREVHTGVELWERPKLTALREAIRGHEIDVLIVYAIDRLSRDPVHLGVILSEADHHGVAVEFVTEQLDDSPEGELIRFVRGYAAKVEHAKFQERSSRGRLTRVEAGKLLPSRRPAYGYQWVNLPTPDDADERTRKRARRVAYKPHPITAAIVRRMFALAAAGATLRGIAAQLTNEGIRTPSGTSEPWRQRTVQFILTNRLYLGEATAWRTRQVKDKETGKRRNLARPVSEHVALPAGTVPPLLTDEHGGVDVALFDAVQTRLRLNRQHSSRNNREPEASLLRGGYVRCGYCDNTMTVRLGKERAYRCARTSEVGSTCQHTITIEALDRAAWEKVSTILTTPELIAAELERMQGSDPDGADLASTERRLTEVVREQRNYIENLGLVSGDAAHLIAQKINALQQQRDQLSTERESILARAAARQRARERITHLEAWCRTVAGNLATATYQDKRLALDALDVRVKVWRKDHTPRYEITAAIPLEVAPTPIVCSAGSSPAHNRNLVVLRWTDADAPALVPVAAAGR